MESSEDLDGPDGYFDSSSAGAPDAEYTSSTLQANMVMTTLPGVLEIGHHQYHSFSFSPPIDDHSLTLQYNSPFTRAEYYNFKNNGYTYCNNSRWNEASQQAPEVAWIGDAESFAHTTNQNNEQWHLGHGEHSIQPSWPHSMPYLHSPQNASIFVTAPQGTFEVGASDSINLHALLQPADLIAAPPPGITNDSNVMIGSMYSTGSPDSYIFKCHDPKCANLTFGRSYEMKRHYNGAHATAPTIYWCEVEGCPRSKVAGDRPFPRKDKVKDHFESVHGGETEMGELMKGTRLWNRGVKAWRWR